MRSFSLFFGIGLFLYCKNSASHDLSLSSACRRFYALSLPGIGTSHPSVILLIRIDINWYTYTTLYTSRISDLEEIYTASSMSNINLRLIYTSTIQTEQRQYEPAQYSPSFLPHAHSMLAYVDHLLEKRKQKQWRRTIHLASCANECIYRNSQLESPAYIGELANNAFDKSSYKRLKFRRHCPPTTLNEFDIYG